MKVGLVYSFEDSNWFSVTKIVGNLIKAYQINVPEINFVHINFSNSHSNDVVAETAKKAFDGSLDKLIFLDHRPHPYSFLSSVGPSELDALKEIVFHIYGDFTLYLKLWKSTEKLLIGRKIKFICASEKQAKLVRKFTQNDCVTTCPFPVDDKEFKFFNKSYKELRSSIGLQENDFVFLYTGRLSEQKKSKELIEVFLQAQSDKRLSRNTKLLMAGKFDSLGSPYLEEEQLLGEYFRKTKKVLEKFSKDLAKNVIFLGNIPNEDLADYYNLADRFISFSCYHDEDYGMSVAESLMSGLPCLLTNWAGYSSFKLEDFSIATKHISVKLGEKRATFDIEEALKNLEDCSKGKLNATDRLNVAKCAHEKLSTQACARALKIILSDKVDCFEGFSKLMRELGSVSEFKRSPFMNESTKTYNQFYYRVYDVYAE